MRDEVADGDKGMMPRRTAAEGNMAKGGSGDLPCVPIDVLALLPASSQSLHRVAEVVASISF